MGGSVMEGWRGRAGVRATWVGASSMVVSDESLLVDGERVRGVEVREAMLRWVAACGAYDVPSRAWARVRKREGSSAVDCRLSPPR